MYGEQKKTAGNGVPVYSYINPTSGGFFISLFVKTGSMYEMEKDSGITHFYEHVAIRNVNKLMEYKLYPLLDRYGIEFNASTYSEMVQFYLSGAKKNFKICADILSKLFCPIKLSKSEIDAERGRIKAEIREADDRTSLSAFSQKLVFDDTSLSRPVMGTSGSVSRISGKRLEEYRGSVFSKENLFIYITGNVSEENIDYLIEKISDFELRGNTCHKNIAPVPKEFCKRKRNVFIKNADFTKVRFNFDLDMSKIKIPESDLLYDILLSGYTSEFYMELSEKRGLIYDFSGSLERYSNIGVFNFSYELKESELYEAICMTVEILHGMKEKVLKEENLMKAGYVDNSSMLYDDARELNFTFAYDGHILSEKNKSLEERTKKYIDITAERMREVARTVFQRSNLILTLKGNKKRIDLQKIENIIKKL